MTQGLLAHILVTLKLSFRSRQALIYGYLVPIFFLIAFAAVFRNSRPPVINQLGQLLTITILGGACFGMPTSMVAERERGIWRRYRLLPASTGALVAGTMVARFVIVLIAAIVQIALAFIFLGMPAPNHPLQLLIAFAFVCFAFLGMGLIIAMLADSVPSVQALGQAIFLPMIMIGGVGIPLTVLPIWARHLARFLPGWYAVAALQPCATGPSGLADAIFSLIALVLIGFAALVTGYHLFRWDADRKLTPHDRRWIVLALAAWVGVGVASELLAHTASPTLRAGVSTPTRTWTEPYDAITTKQINSINFDNLPDDNGYISPLADSLTGLSDSDKKRMSEFAQQLVHYPPANVSSLTQRAFNLLSIAAIADLAQDPDEAQIAFIVQEQLKSTIPPEDLPKALAWAALHSADAHVLTTAPELGLKSIEKERSVRERVSVYASKFLKNLLKST